MLSSLLLACMPVMLCRPETPALAFKLTVTPASWWFGGQKLCGVAAAVQLGGVASIGPPRVFRTAKLMLIHAASCRFRYSSRASCGVR